MEKYPLLAALPVHTCGSWLGAAAPTTTGRDAALILIRTMEAAVSHQCWSRSQASYDALFFHRRVLTMATLSTPLQKKKQQQQNQPKLSFSSAATPQKPSLKPTKLLRTWTEGRKIASTSTGPKNPLQKQAPSLKDRMADSTADVDRSLEITESETEAEDDENYEEDDDGEDEDDPRHSSSAHATQETLQASLQSITAHLNCKHFKSCSGCVLETALDQPPIFKDAQRFSRCHGIEDLKLTTGSVWEWRCKAKLAVRGTPTNPVVGLYAEGTHDVVDIPGCRTHHPKINAAVELLKAGIQELGIQPYDEDTGKGELRYVQMAVTTYDTSIPVGERYAKGKVQIVLVWNDRSEQSASAGHLHTLSEFLWRKGGAKSANFIVHSVWANFQTSRTNIIFGGRWRHLLGEQHCWERMGGVDVSLTPASFSQANLQVFESLLRKLQKFVKPGKAVVELYAGSGIIGLSLAATCGCRAVRCVEVNKEAKTSFDMSLSRLTTANKSKISWHCADVSVSPINWLKGSDVVVVDPPRKGLDASLIDALRTASLRGESKGMPASKEALEKAEKRPWILRAQQAGIEASKELGEADSTWPDTLIYISCGWEAFKRDCANLIDGGAWHLFAGQAFNLFPGTDSIELLAIFKRGKKKRPKKNKAKKASLGKKKRKQLTRQASL